MACITASSGFIFRCIEAVPQLLLIPKDLTLLRPLIVVPAYKSLQGTKFVSPPFVQVEPFLKFTPRLRVIYARGYVFYPILLQMLPKYAGWTFFFVFPVTRELAAVIGSNALIGT